MNTPVSSSSSSSPSNPSPSDRPRSLFFGNALTESHFLTRSLRTSSAFMASIAVIGVVAFAGGAFGRSDEDAATLDRPRALPVDAVVAVAEPGYPVEREFLGRLEAERESELSFERIDRVIAIAVDEGDTVAAGTPLATLDLSMLDARRAQLDADLTQAAATLAELENGSRQEDVDEARAIVAELEARAGLAQSTEKRTAGAFEQRAVSAQQLDEARLATSVARAQLAAARERLGRLEAGPRAERIDAQRARVISIREQLRLNDVDREKSQLVAPFDAVVLRRHVDEGETVSPGRAILRLMERAPLELRVGVSRDAVAALPVGSEHTVDVHGESYAAVVRSVTPERNDATRTVAVRLTIADLPSRFHGDLARARVQETREGDGFWIATEALTESWRGLWSCYVAEPVAANDLAPDDPVGATHRIGRRELLIRHTEGDRTFVAGTLAAGELVIVEGIHRLVPHQLVRLGKTPQ